jgi:hypothetical protein
VDDDTPVLGKVSFTLAIIAAFFAAENAKRLSFHVLLVMQQTVSHCFT